MNTCEGLLSLTMVSLTPSTLILFYFTFLCCCFTCLNSLCIIPAAENPISQELQQRRRSQTGRLRRVLLTTQIQVRKCSIVRSITTSATISMVQYSARMQVYSSAWRVWSAVSPSFHFSVLFMNWTGIGFSFSPDVHVLSCSCGYFSYCHPQNQFAALNVPKKDNSQIEGPSIANSYGFKVSMQNLQDAKALHEVSCTLGSYALGSYQYWRCFLVCLFVLCRCYCISCRTWWPAGYCKG